MTKPIIASELPQSELYDTACQQFQDHLEVFYQKIAGLGLSAETLSAVYEAAGYLMCESEQEAFTIGYNMAVAACNEQPVEFNLIVLN
jgi:hypothetical protein